MALLFNNEERLKSLIAKLRQKFKVIVYIATSEDDYIAADDGNIDWLNNFSNELFDPKNGGEAAAGSLPDDCGYSEFYHSIDINVMGRKTFDQVTF